jgi:hypothetical protein
MKNSRLHLYRSTTSWSYIFECTTSASDVKASEAIGGLFVADHGLQSLRLLSVNFFLSGARPALPMGVAPEAIAEIVRVEAKKYA